MSNPSFENIDRWLFELTEGNLSPEQEAQLKSFLLQHPELDVDRDIWDLTKVSVAHNGYQNKKQLEKRRKVLPYFVGVGAVCICIVGFFVFNNINEDGSQLLGLNKSNVKVQQPNNKIKTKISDGSSNNGNSSENKNISAKGIQDNMPNSSHSENINIAQIYSNSQQSNTTESSNGHITESLTSVNDGFVNPYIQPQLALKSFDLSLKQINNDIKHSKPNQSENQEVNAKTRGFSINNLGIKSKAKRFVNNVDNAMKNPVALINLKDNWYQVPGLTPTEVNFASVGSILSTRIQTSTRLQWFGNDNQQFSNQIAVDAYAHQLKGGIGFQMNHSFYGNGGIQNYNAALIYSPKIPLSANFVLEPSVRFKMGTKQLNPESLGNVSQVELDRFNAIDYYSNGSNPIGRTLWYRDVGAGLMLNTKWFYASFQADNLMQHFDNIYSADIENPRKAPYHYMASFGGEYMSKKRTMSLSPYLVYQHFGDLEELWGGVNFRYKWIKLGAAVSSNLEPSASLGFRFNHFTISYSADYTKSAILNKSLLSHQLTLRFNTKPCRIGQRILAK